MENKWFERTLIVLGIIGIIVLLYAGVANAAGTVCQIANGCTGTSTAPTYGKVLVGDSSGNYEFAATSTFGAASGGTVTSVGLSTPNATFTLGGTNPVTTSGTFQADLNLAHSNWWTARQNFANATTSALEATSTDIFLDGYTSAFLEVNASHQLTAYAGASNPCSANQAPTTLSALGVLGGCTSTFLTANQTITLSGAVSGSGTTAITTSYAGTLGNTLGGTGQNSSSWNGLAAVNAGVWSSLSTTSMNASITGNAGTATALQNARTINGISFNGTANIVVASTTLLSSDNNTFTGNTIFVASTTHEAQVNLVGASSTVFSTGNLWDTALTSGDCVQASTGGVLTSAAGACGTGGGSGTVTSVAAGTGLNGGTITTSGTLSLVSYLATGTAPVAGQVNFFGNSASTPEQIDGNSAFTFSTSGNTLLTVTNASTTNLTAGTSLGIPSSSNPSPTVAGYISESSNAPYQIHIGNGNSGTVVFDSRRMLAVGYPDGGATTTWTGTTTVTAGFTPAMTFNTIQCATTPLGSTLEVRLYYGPTPTSFYYQASSTGGIEAITTNNTPSANASTTVDFGNPASSPTSITCTVTGVLNGV